MRRREFIAGLASTPLAWPLGAHAQRRDKFRVGSLYAGIPIARYGAPGNPYQQALIAEMGKLGYIEGQNIIYDMRYAKGDLTRLPALADELIVLNPDVLVTIEPHVPVLLSKTSTIPIVMLNSSDPVAAGLVKSLSHPGGIVTGLSMMSAELGPKQIELLREMIPGLSRVGHLHDTKVLSSKLAEQLTRKAALKLGIRYIPYYVTSLSDLDRAFAQMERDRPEAVLHAAGSGLLTQYLRLILENMERLRIAYCLPSGAPTIHVGRRVLAGYGPDWIDAAGLAAAYVDKILKGANPSDLPIQQPNRFKLFINLKIARALGLDIPPTLLARADVVDE